MVGLLGGMGPAAGVQFLGRFVDACTGILAETGQEIRDQSYPPHFLSQTPVPDRTTALLESPRQYSQVLSALSGELDHFLLQGVSLAAIACNTAHAWHGPLQNAYPSVEILHIAHEMAQFCALSGYRRVILLATRGTYENRIYQPFFDAAGIDCIVPTGEEIDSLMAGIYQGVKANDLQSARHEFESVVHSAAGRTACTTVIMGCTEIPLALEDSAVGPDIRLVDPTAVLARALALKAFGIRH